MIKIEKGFLIYFIITKLQNQEISPNFKSNHYADLYFVFGGYAKIQKGWRCSRRKC